jgi:hypothetical protein
LDIDLCGVRTQFGAQEIKKEEKRRNTVAQYKH